MQSGQQSGLLNLRIRVSHAAGDDRHLRGGYIQGLRGGARVHSTVRHLNMLTSKFIRSILDCELDIQHRQDAHEGSKLLLVLVLALVIVVVEDSYGHNLTIRSMRHQPHQYKGSHANGDSARCVDTKIVNLPKS